MNRLCFQYNSHALNGYCPFNLTGDYKHIVEEEVMGYSTMREQCFVVGYREFHWVFSVKLYASVYDEVRTVARFEQWNSHLVA